MNVEEFDMFRSVRCPICRRPTYDNHYICPVCGWEYDGTIKGYSESNKTTAEEYKSIFEEKVNRKDYKLFKKYIDSFTDSDLICGMTNTYLFCKCVVFGENFETQAPFLSPCPNYAKLIKYVRAKMIFTLNGKALELAQESLKKSKTNDSKNLDEIYQDIEEIEKAYSISNEILKQAKQDIDK